jgi:hypothetical protein
MGHTIPLTRALDDSHLAPAAPAADWAHYHHPHFVRSEPGPREGNVTVYLRTFTGREEEPQMPGDVWADRAISREQRALLQGECNLARRLWSEARLRWQAVPLLHQAAPLWQAWTTARDELTAVFEQFRQTPDGFWRAQLLKLQDAETSARTAAESFDRVAEELTGLARQQQRAVPEDDDLPLREVAREIGLDIDGWHISWHEDYFSPWGGDTLTRRLQCDIDAQRAQLSEVATLAGETSLPSATPAS